MEGTHVYMIEVSERMKVANANTDGCDIDYIIIGYVGMHGTLQFNFIITLRIYLYYSHFTIFSGFLILQIQIFSVINRPKKAFKLKGNELFIRIQLMQ